MSTTMQLPAHSWAAAHRALMIVLAVTLAAVVAVTIALLVTRATGSETVAPGLPSIELVPDACQFAAPGTAC